MADWIGLAVPIAYLSILVISFATFSSLYRKRKISKSASLEPWFPPHLQKNIYLSLLHLEPSEGSEKPTRVPDSVLKAALLRRATEDIHRLIAIRNAKGALKTLLARGSVGDDLGQRFDRAEKEIEDELKDVVNEANAFAPNWGQTVFQSASEMANNNLIRARMAELQSQAAVERAWWDKKRANKSSEFMKELDAAVEEQSSVSSKVATLDSSSTSSRTGSVVAPAAAGPGRGSDDDAVIVEGGGPAVGGQGSARKKKAKK